MPYNFVNLGEAVIQLSQRLYLDQVLFLSSPNAQFWTFDELSAYVVEALRTFNAFSGFWKDEFSFPAVATQTWYDLTAQPNTLRPFTVTDVDLYKLMEYHLLEPATGATWSGSKQFSISDLMNALQRRRDEILSVSGCTLTQALIAAVPGRTVLPDTTIDIRRVAWLPVANPAGFTASPLWSGDAFEAQSYKPDYLQNPQGAPSIYMRSSQPPLSFDVDRPPAVAGEYDVLTVNAGGVLSAAQASPLNIPDDWAWLAKWAALADLLGRESNARDSLRARYCEQRYQMGLRLLAEAPALLLSRINNVAVQIDPVQSADDYAPGWQGLTAGAPVGIYVAGQNLIALSPAPDANPYSVTASVVRNAPVPSDPADPLQVSRENYDAIIDYAQHLAAFKMGGAEFMATLPLLDRFIKVAAIYNSKLREFGPFSQTIMETGELQEERSPRLETGTLDNG